MSFEFPAVEFWHWFAVAGFAILLEMLMPGIFFMFLAVAAFVVGIVLAIFPATPFLWQVALLGAITAIATYGGRKYLVRFQRRRDATNIETLNRRGSELIGQTIALIEPIVAGRGRARVGDTTWTVTGPDAPVGALVEVIATTGVELRVKPRP